MQGLAGWAEFALAMIVFLGSHRIPALLGVRSVLTRAFGPRGYTALFSVMSLVLLWWVIKAAGRAPYVPLWDQSGAARWAVNLAVPLAIVLGSFGVAAPNPFAFEGRASGFDPQRPGIAGITRQPLLWGLLIWAAVHLWANGDLAHVIVFGTFAGFAAIGMPLVERRRRRQMGPEDWARLSARTGLIPMMALVAGRWRPHGLPSGIRAGIAGVVWAVLWHMHGPVIGVWPAP